MVANSIRMHEHNAAVTDSALAIDEAAVLERLNGDRHLLNELALTCLEVLPDQIEALRLAIQTENMPEAMKNAHMLKGSLGIFSARGVYEATEQLERICARNDGSLLAAALTDLEAEAARFSQALKDLVGDGGRHA